MPFHFDEIESTQTFLKDLCQSDPDLANLEYAIADRQTAGLGRHGRAWVSERGNLFISIWLNDFSLPLTWIPHWVGVSLIEALQALGIPKEHLKLKWPNDLVIDREKKTAVILCEKVGEGIVVGVGVNLISAPALSDRETANIASLVPEIPFQGFHLKLANELITVLREEPSLEDLVFRYQEVSLLKSGDAIQWIDLQTQKTGKGIFLRYGQFGELLVNAAGLERPLFSEEIKLVL